MLHHAFNPRALRLPLRKGGAAQRRLAFSDLHCGGCAGVAPLIARLLRCCPEQGVKCDGEEDAAPGFVNDGFCDCADGSDESGVLLWGRLRTLRCY